MKFENADGKPVEINFQNFEKMLPENKPGLSLVKFKDGRQEWIKATRDDILKATAEEQLALGFPLPTLVQDRNFTSGGLSDWNEIESRIQGKSIASVRTNGIISEQKTKFLIEQYLQEFREKNGWDGIAYIHPRLF